MPYPIDPNNPLVRFQGNLETDKGFDMSAPAAICTPWMVANSNSQAKNGSSNAWKRIYEILDGATNFNGGADPTNHANVVILPNPHRFPLLEIAHSYTNASAATVSTQPKVVGYGNSEPSRAKMGPILSLRPDVVDNAQATGFPDLITDQDTIDALTNPQTINDAIPFSKHGQWFPFAICGPGGEYLPDPQQTVGPTDLQTADFGAMNGYGGVPAVEAVRHNFGAATQGSATPVVVDRKFIISNANYMRTHGARRVILLVTTAAAFSATTRSVMLTRFRSA